MDNTEQHIYTLQSAKDIFAYRYTIISEIENLMEKYYRMRNRSLCRGGGASNMVLELGCRVQTSRNTEFNAMDAMLILEEEIVNKQAFLTKYDNLLYSVINNVNISQEQYTIFTEYYFSERPQTYYSCARNCTAKMLKIVKKDAVRYCITRVFNCFVVPFLNNPNCNFTAIYKDLMEE